MAITFLKGIFDSFVDFMRLALPCAKANGWNLIASIERELLAMGQDQMFTLQSAYFHELVGGGWHEM